MQAARYCGLGKSSIYNLSYRHVGLFKKYLGKTLVDFAVLDGILDRLPLATSPKQQPVKTAAAAAAAAGMPSTGAEDEQRLT
jgi:hypothetical protein